MHEFAICEQLLKTVLAELETLRQPPPRLLKVRVVVGGLQQIVPDSLSLAYELLSKDTNAAGATLEIVQVPAALACNACGWQGEVRDREFVCPTCGAVDIRVTGGKELYLESLEVEDESDHDQSLSRPDGSERGVGTADPRPGPEA